MDLKKLQILRIMVPAAMILVAAWVLGRITGLWAFELTTDYRKMSASLIPVFLGAVYAVTPLREISNRQYFDEVSENLRSGLVKVSGLPDGPDLSWKAVRGVFYSLVDNDPSLKVKASIAYNNGILWTSAADARAVALIFFYAALVIADSGRDSALGACLVFLLAAILTVPISVLLTRRHIDIGNQQIEIIEHNYSDNLRTKLNAARNRAVGNGSR